MNTTDQVTSLGEALPSLPSRMTDFHWSVPLTILTCIFVYKLVCPKGTTASLPPGPKPLPIIGNVHEMIRKDPMKCFQDWHQQYGPMVTIRYGSRLVISVSSFDICHELMDKRGAKYSSRPRFIIASEHMTKELNLAVIPYNERWKHHNRIATTLLDPTMTKRYRPIQDLESKKVLFDLLSSNDFTKILTRFSASLVLTLGYGIHLPDNNRSEPHELLKINQHPFEALGNMYCQLVELFPILDLTPTFMAPWKWNAANAERETTAFHMKHLGIGKSHSTSWNWILEAMKSQVGQTMSDEEIAYLVGTLEQAGFEAILTVIRLLVKVIVLNPECMRKAHEEIDRVVGTERLPNLDDQSNLPYIDAMITEAMRWQPPTPFAIPHSNTEDDEYMGYRIPKGAMVIPNIWVMAYDANDFPDPFEYRPERWLQDHPAQHSSFGFGRRICPGRHLGYSSVFLAIARMLWAYKFTHAFRDGKRVEIDPWDLKMTFTAASREFEAEFHVRSPKHQEIIETEWRDTEKNVGAILEDIRPRRAH